MVEPNPQLLGDPTVPTITLAGKAWPVPMLAPKQNKHVVPTILKVVPHVLAAGDGKGKFDLDRFAKAMDTTTYDALILVTWMALTRAHPSMTREEFEEMPIGTMELVLAVLIIAQQTGVIRPGKAGEPKTGEAPAGNSQTGMP